MSTAFRPIKTFLSILQPSFRRNFLFVAIFAAKESLIRNPVFILNSKKANRIPDLRVAPLGAPLVRNDGVYNFAPLKFTLLSFLLLLTACGFSPIYGAQDGTGQPVAKALSSVAIDTIADRNGQILRNKLIDRMYSQGRPETPNATLNVSLKSSEKALGVQKDATTTRSQLSMTATFTLTDTEGHLRHKGKAHAVASYSKLDAQYGTLAAQRNAQERALNEIGEQIVNNLSLYYAEKAPQETKEGKSLLAH